MKKFYSAFIVLFVTTINAQNYTFLNSTASYANLTTPISLNNGEVWDDPEYPILLPFNFIINGVSTNTVMVSDSYISIFDGSSIVQIISPLSVDLVDRGSMGETSLSPISYKIDGTPGTRIAKVEFNNCGAFNDDNLTMFVNFQVWLFETTNVIEFRYGTSSVSSPAIFYDGETGGVIGLTSVNEDNGDLSSSIFLIGDAEIPTTTTALGYITGTPSNGRLYRFTPNSLSTNHFSQKAIQIYPNPANESLIVGGDFNATSFKIFDGIGKLVSSGPINVTENIINVSHLKAGMYFIKLDEAPAIKFVKL